MSTTRTLDASEIWRTRRWRKQAGLAGFLLSIPVFLCSPGSTEAHPHIFIQQSAVIVLGAAGVEAVRLTWTLDEDTSTQVLFGFDVNQDGRFGPGETEALRRGWLEPLSEYSYFVAVKVNGATAEVGPARGFHASVANGLVTFAFTLPLRAPRARAGDVEITLDDPTNFTAFSFRPRSPVVAEAPGRYHVACAVSLGGADGANPDVARCTYR